MKIIVPDYYFEFKCIADKCKHTCCKGWEVEIDSDSLTRFEQVPEIKMHIEKGEDNHFRLLEGDVCPFLLENGLCDMILRYGEEFLCQTCTDHPRFRNYWSDRIEMGLGLVCEEAARLILGRKHPMTLVEIDADMDAAGNNMEKPGMDEPDSECTVGLNTTSDDLPEDEEWLMDYRDDLLKNNEADGPLGRLREYLIYRHIADALYDDRLEERLRFVDIMVAKVRNAWAAGDGSFESLIEIVRQLSYDIEYDEDEKEKYLVDSAANVK